MIAELNYPENVALDKCGNLYIADFNNARVRKITFNPYCLPEKVPEITINELSIYPNPATTILNIHHSTSTSQETLLITDLLGTEVYKENLSGISTTISISTWSAGIYFYEVRGLGLQIPTSARGKFVVQK